MHEYMPRPATMLATRAADNTFRHPFFPIRVHTHTHTNTNTTTTEDDDAATDTPPHLLTHLHSSILLFT